MSPQLGQQPFCVTGKTVYSSRESAAEALARINDEEGRALTASYRCPICRDWHLTSQPQYSRERRWKMKTIERVAPFVPRFSIDL